MALPDDHPDRSHPDLLRACEDAHTFPERLWFTARSDERTTARRAVACRLLHAGWKPGRIARLMGVHYMEVWRWARRRPPALQRGNWRPPPGVSDTAYGRKLRRAAKP